jgi:hypothetical protein
MKKILAVLFLMALLTGCLQPSEEEKSTLQVNAIGTLKATPDIAVISFGVITQDEDPNKALKANSEKMNEVISALERLGITDENITTSQVALYPEYEEDKIREGEMRRIVGYKAVNTVKVTVSSGDDIGRIIDEAVRSGANEVRGLYFKLSEIKSAIVYREALKIAVSEAKEKAEIIADSMGIKLAGPLKVSESGPIMPARSKALAVEELVGTSTPVSPGELEVSASVYVEFEIKRGVKDG